MKFHIRVFHFSVSFKGKYFIHIAAERDLGIIFFACLSYQCGIKRLLPHHAKNMTEFKTNCRMSNR